MAANNDRDCFIMEYFQMGFSTDILECLLFNHQIRLSLRQLKRILAKKGLGRRRFSTFNEVMDRIQDEVNGSGSCVGYRSMWQKLVVDHQLSVSKEFVRHAPRIMDPEGVDRRLRHRLKRRQYHAC